MLEEETSALGLVEKEQAVASAQLLLGGEKEEVAETAGGRVEEERRRLEQQLADNRAALAASKEREYRTAAELESGDVLARQARELLSAAQKAAAARKAHPR